MRLICLRGFMSSQHKNLSEAEGSRLLNAAHYKFAIVWSEWNPDITKALCRGAHEVLIKYGAKPENIIEKAVPGSFELTMGAQFVAEKTKADAIICIGCVIQGETRHFDFICDAVAHGVTNVSLKYNKPVIFGVLTPNTLEQAQDRAGGKHGNKGDEAAVTALKMIALKKGL